MHQGLCTTFSSGPKSLSYTEDRSLSNAEIASITRWVEEGGAEGDPATAPPASSNSKPFGGLSRVDRTLTLPVEYLPQKAPDDYRCFVVDWPETTTRYLTGFRVEPGNTAIVHHVVAYHAKPEEAAYYQQKDDAEPGPGYTCFGGAGGRAAWLNVWAPGANAGDFPAGTGVPIAPGSKIILQMHYNIAPGRSGADRTSVSLKLDDSVEKVAYILPWLNPSWSSQRTMPIPAGQSDVKHSFVLDPTPFLTQFTNGTLQSNQPMTLHSAFLHMHTLGKSIRTDIVRENGAKECMLDLPRWDFSWQGTYLFEKPKVLKPGDKLSVECHWDNSAPGATDANWGEGTGDEMCLGVYYVTQ